MSLYFLLYVLESYHISICDFGMVVYAIYILLTLLLQVDYFYSYIQDIPTWVRVKTMLYQTHININIVNTNFILDYIRFHIWNQVENTSFLKFMVGTTYDRAYSYVYFLTVYALVVLHQASFVILLFLYEIFHYLPYHYQ